MKLPIRPALCARAALPFLFVLVGGCAGAPTQTTVASGVVATNGHWFKSDDATIERLVQERDKAQRQAAEFERAADVARERGENAMNSVLARTAFEDAVRAELDRLDARVRSLKARVKVRAIASERAQIAAVARAVRDRRAAVETALHRVHALPTVEWTTFKQEIAVAVAQIARDIELGTPKALEREDGITIGHVRVLG